MVYNQVKKESENPNLKGPVNEFRHEGICIFILNKYFALANMWTNLMGYFVDSSGDHVSNAPVEYGFYLQKQILLSVKSVRPGFFIKVTRKDYLATLKEIRYRYNMFDETDLNVGDSMILDENEIDEVNEIIRIDKEHSYSEIIECLKDEEEMWGKKNERKRKAISQNILSSGKKSQEFTTKSKDIEAVIKTDPNISNEINEISRIEKEHTYKLVEVINLIDNRGAEEVVRPPEMLYYLYRYDNLYNEKYVLTSNQMDIGFFNILDYREWIT